MAIFYNQATISLNGVVTGSNIITGEIEEVLSVSKNAVMESYTPGSSIVYAVSIVNSGNTAYTDLTLTDDLGSYAVEQPEGEPELDVVPLTFEEGTVSLYINGVRQAAPVVTSTEPLTITGIDIPAEGNAVILYAARANTFAPLGENASITNTAEVSGNGIGTPLTASAEAVHDSTADLAISKSLTPSTVPENGELTYTFIIQNFGSSAVTEDDSVIFRDVFDPVLDITEVTFNGEPITAGTGYTYSTADGIFTSLEGQITVPAAEYTQDPATGAWSVQPGTSTLVITGTFYSAPQQNTRR
ncbi:MAG: hypothetical protein IJ874_02445 [Ruminococcus sp.]|nr:hypothetical protein [Ruminococcus sp.]